MSDVERSTANRPRATLEALGASRDGLTVADLARAVGRDKSIVSRRLRPLVGLGVVEPKGGRRR